MTFSSPSPVTPAAARDLLAGGPWALDGGLASDLEARGYDLSGALWSARLLRDDPGAVVAVHRGYYEAGAMVAISASYQASRAGFAAAGLDADEADRLLSLSVALARRARDEVRDARAADDAEMPLLVAASVGPYGAIRHDGSEYRGRYGLSHQELVDFHRERLEVLAAAEPDLLAVETIPDLDEAAALVEVLADFPGLPAYVSFSCRDGSTVSAGQPAREAAALVASAPTAVAVGVNCTAPEHVGSLLDEMAAGAPGLALVAYPNAGRTWDAMTESWVGEGASTLPADAVAGWVSRGARLVGGCCGLGPDAIQSVATTLAPLRPSPPPASGCPHFD
jgi:homocysteine S-methyltransferase